MTNTSAHATRSESSLANLFRWRVIDIVIASIIGVACSVVFLVWNVAYAAPSALLGAVTPGLTGLVLGPWLIAAVIAGLIVRKPGAAIYAEMVAASISALAGNEWGMLTLVSGAVQGVGAEIALALLRYRSFGVLAAGFMGLCAAAGAAIYEWFFFNFALDTAYKTIYAGSQLVSGLVIAGFGGWLIVRGLAATGALDRFQVGREVSKRV